MRWFLIALALTNPAHAQSLTGPADRVIDGDTFVMQGETIRLWGIDAPELPSQDGYNAMAFLKALLNNQTLTCQIPPSGQDRDRYDIRLRQCFIDNVDVAEILVGSGLAEDWPRDSGGYYGE